MTADDRVSETRILLGTYCTITLAGSDNLQLINDAFELCEKLEALFSMHTENSDVRRINNAGGAAAQVSIETIELINKSIQFAEISDGMFDITIGRLSSLWNFSGESENTQNIPSQADISNALESVGYRNIIVHNNDNAIELANPRAWIDLGAIAKGYIADKVVEFLIRNNVSSAVVDLGGDIFVIGSRPDGNAWRLGVNKPFTGRDELSGVLEVTDSAVVSSGVYERQFFNDGLLYHHILDPKTGMPSVTDVISATIIASDAVTGEGLATIAVLAGSERAVEIFEKAPGYIGAVLILDDESIITYGDVSFEQID